MYMSHHQTVQQQGKSPSFNGIVFSDVSFGFMPAFKNLKDQRIHLSTDAYGRLSVVHMFDGLPDHWINEKDSLGKALTLKSEIIAGFMRNERFYTLSEILHCICDA